MRKQTGDNSVPAIWRWIRIPRVLLALCVFALGCDSASPAAPATAALGQDFVIRIGEAATIEGADFTVTLVAVIEDSRCPVDLTCVWAGNAKVELEVRRAVGESVTLVLNTELEPRATSVGPHELRYVDLAPLPHANAEERVQAGRSLGRIQGASLGGLHRRQPGAGRAAARTTGQHLAAAAAHSDQLLPR